VSLTAFLRQVIAMLDGCHVPHMLSGSVASTQYSVPRTTHDIDIVVQLVPESLECVLSAVEAFGMYAPRSLAEDAVVHRGQFNIIDSRTGWKVDVIVQRDRPFSRTEFDRRRPHQIDGVDLFIATPEDVILSKLEWAKAGESDRQLRDVSNILDVSGSSLDMQYLARWAAELGVADLLATVAPGSSG